MSKLRSPNSSHWGNFIAHSSNGKLNSIETYPEDIDRSPLLDSLLDVHDVKSRVARPVIRQGFLNKTTDGTKRGLEPFVEVPWDEAFDIAAEAITNIKSRHGNDAIFGGSYGWASAGRFHHALSQTHRFLNLIGGYTASRNSYSAACAEVILPHIFGPQGAGLFAESPPVEDIVAHTELIVCFGGMALKNTQVNPGGLGGHTASSQTQLIKEAGVRVVNFSPLKDDVSSALNAQWVPSRPGTDTAIMLGLAHTLVTNNWHDLGFLNTYCEGFNQFLPYLLGEKDGQAKSAEWASSVADCDQALISNLAQEMHEKRTLINLSLSVQRTEHGEQSYWVAAALGAMLGQIGLPGEGVGFGYGAMHNFGFNSRQLLPFKIADFPQGKNPVQRFIPVAKLADMLLNPGKSFNYNGETLEYPDIKLVYWAGGNPFHHHQNINRLRRAWTKPETIIVNEFAWTPTARFSDIVFPANTSLERNDFGASIYDNHLTPMRQVLPTFEESASDFEIFSGLSQRLGCAEEFCEGKNEMEWLQTMYQRTCDNAATYNITLPAFDAFWSGEQIPVKQQIPAKIFMLEDFRSDPVKNALDTPSGKIEIYSSTIADFDYPDCLGHPAWFEKENYLGSPRAQIYPYHLVSNQPKTRLHSQWDRGRTSLNKKISERERARINHLDAEKLGLKDGDVVQIYNDIGATLAGIEITTEVAQNIIELPTGAWYDPQNPAEEMSLDVHGNPNVLTDDRGSSSLAQGTAAHSCLVNLKLYQGDLPALSIDRPPQII